MSCRYSASFQSLGGAQLGVLWRVGLGAGLPQRGTGHPVAGTQLSPHPSLDTALRTSASPPQQPGPVCHTHSTAHPDVAFLGQEPSAPEGHLPGRQHGCRAKRSGGV